MIRINLVTFKMKVLNFFIKNQVVYSLILLMLFQSCIAYQATPTTLNSAVDKGPVKLVDNEGRIYKFKNVGLKDGIYLGTGNVYSNLEYVTRLDGGLSILDSANFNQVYLKDVDRSQMKSIGLGIGITAFAVLVVLTVVAAIQLSNF